MQAFVRTRGRKVERPGIQTGPFFVHRESPQCMSDIGGNSVNCGHVLGGMRSLEGHERAHSAARSRAAISEPCKRRDQS